MFQLPVDIVSGSLGTLSNLFNDFKPLLLMIFGVGIAMWIIEFILDIAQERAERKARLEEAEAGLEAQALSPIFSRYHAHRVAEKRKELVEEA
jgi:hypothetical protein